MSGGVPCGGMRRIPVLVAPLPALLCACGSPPPSPSPPAATPSATVAATAAPRATASASTSTAAAATIDVPSLHLHATLIERPCSDYEAAGVPLPDAAQAWFMDCAAPQPCTRAEPCGFYAIIAAAGGVLGPLAGAPAGTAIHVVSPTGVAIDRVLSAGGGRSSPNPDGSWPGHGIPPGTPLLAAIRTASSQAERQGDPPPG